MGKGQAHAIKNDQSSVGPLVPQFWPMPSLHIPDFFVIQDYSWWLIS